MRACLNERKSVAVSSLGELLWFAMCHSLVSGWRKPSPSSRIQVLSTRIMDRDESAIPIFSRRTPLSSQRTRHWPRTPRSMLPAAAKAATIRHRASKFAGGASFVTSLTPFGTRARKQLPSWNLRLTTSGSYLVSCSRSCIIAVSSCGLDTYPSLASSGTPVNTSLMDLDEQLSFLGVEKARPMINLLKKSTFRHIGDRNVSRGGGGRRRRQSYDFNLSEMPKLGNFLFLMRPLMMRHSQKQKYRATDTTLMSLPPKVWMQLCRLETHRDRVDCSYALCSHCFVA